MLRVISQTFLGLILLAAGCYLFFLFLQGLADSSASWAVFCAIPLLGAGIFLLVRAGKSDATVIKKTQIPQLGSSGGGGLENQLHKNNELVEEYSNMNHTKDKLRILEAAGPSEEGR